MLVSGTPLMIANNNPKHNPTKSDSGMAQRTQHRGSGTARQVRLAWHAEPIAPLPEAAGLCVPDGIASSHPTLRSLDSPVACFRINSETLGNFSDRPCRERREYV